ncbi:MAG: fibronectin type III domain-containing protein, partial [Prevotella sp.]|nr:fibronectin type III domain-containing protein [Prevotella sp.]
MKKSLLRLMMTVCFIMATMSAKADTVGGLCGMEGDNMITWELNLDFGLLTIYGNGRMADFDDPSEAPWWSYSKSIIHLIVEDGITHISQAGFQYMPYLESAEIAETVTSIGDNAFYGSMLNKVIPTNWTGDIDANLLPDGLLTIGYYAFAETKLENIILPTTLERIGAAAFAYNDQLLEVANLATVPPAMERAVFYDCNKLWAIHVPDDQVEAYCNADGWATYTNIIVPASGHAEHSDIQPEEIDLLMPGSMYATDLGQTSALIICSLSADAIAWNLNYRQETADDEQEMRWVTIDNLTTRSCTLEDLKPATNYVVRLQAVYEDGQVSGWTRALPFATASEDVDRQNKQETAYYEYKEVKKAECDAMAMPEIDDKHCALFIEQAKQAIDDLGFNENLSFDENLANLDEITRLLAIDLSLHRAEMAGEQRGAVTIDETTFPDENFRKWVLSQKYGKDGILTEEEIAKVESIDVAYQDIKSLKGIEYFT